LILDSRLKMSAYGKMLSNQSKIPLTTVIIILFLSKYIWKKMQGEKVHWKKSAVPFFDGFFVLEDLLNGPRAGISPWFKYRSMVE